MLSLERGQTEVMAALDLGPAHLPAGLFAGPPERVLAGMKVHANTISHARLIALEDTFPRTRETIGDQKFNEHSRLFLQQPGVTAQPLADIGYGFASFLEAQAEATGIADLARFEWLWLQAFHAADAPPLALADLAGMAEEELLGFELQRHPAAVISRFAPLVHELIGAEVPGLCETEAILIARPDADVLIAPATRLMAELLRIAETRTAISNLLIACGESLPGEGEDAEKSMQALVALINVGALTAA